VIQKIVNQLAVDADNFFDQVAVLNDALLDEEKEARQASTASSGQKGRSAAPKEALCGLSKRLFFAQLAEYGVALSEQDKALICQVFGLETARDKLDYLKLDQAFEGEQQHLYAAD